MAAASVYEGVTGGYYGVERGAETTSSYLGLRRLAAASWIRFLRR